MEWFWTDDLARLLMSEDAIAPELLSHWISEPCAHRGEADPIAFARNLLALEVPAATESSDAA